MTGSADWDDDEAPSTVVIDLEQTQEGQSNEPQENSRFFCMFYSGWCKGNSPPSRAIFFAWLPSVLLSVFPSFRTKHPQGAMVKREVSTYGDGIYGPEPAH